MQFNHFLVRDEEPLLFHAGFKKMFPELGEAVAELIDPATLRYIGWSHFESDEIGRGDKLFTDLAGVTEEAFALA